MIIIIIIMIILFMKYYHWLFLCAIIIDTILGLCPVIDHFQNKCRSSKPSKSLRPLSLPRDAHRMLVEIAILAKKS